MVLCGVSPHPIGLVDFYLILEMSCSRAFHQTLISSQPQALSPATRRVIIKPAGRHTQTDASSSGPDALIQRERLVLAQAHGRPLLQRRFVRLCFAGGTAHSTRAKLLTLASYFDSGTPVSLGTLIFPAVLSCKGVADHAKALLSNH